MWLEEITDMRTKELMQEINVRRHAEEELRQMNCTLQAGYGVCP